MKITKKRAIVFLIVLSVVIIGITSIIVGIFNYMDLYTKGIICNDIDKAIGDEALEYIGIPAKDYANVTNSFYTSGRNTFIILRVVIPKNKTEEYLSILEQYAGFISHDEDEEPELTYNKHPLENEIYIKAYDNFHGTPQNQIYEKNQVAVGEVSQYSFGDKTSLYIQTVHYIPAIAENTEKCVLDGTAIKCDHSKNTPLFGPIIEK